MKSRSVVLVVFFMLSVLSGVPAIADHQSCESPLPFVLNLALPRLPKAYGFDAESLKQGVHRFMKDFYQEHGTCPHQRPLQVNITVASEYEILDWLSQGLVQAAVVPELTLYLLTERDGLDLRVLDLEEHPVGELLLPALGGRARSGRLSGGEWREGNTAQDLEAFRTQLWRTAKGERPIKDAPRYRIVLASHLSTTGFLDPVLDTARWLDQKLAGQTGNDELRERFWQAFFGNARFAIDCDSLEPERPLVAGSCWELPKAEEMAGEGPVEILFPGESALRHERGWAYARSSARAADSDGAGDSYREHLVIAGPETETIFDGGHAFQEARPARSRELKALFGDPKTGTPPRAFLPILAPEPLFGGRTFGFTVDEVVRLLRQDQTTSERAELALVLPGGGVKAAYQSRIVDDLYSRGYLKNFRVRDSRGRKPLDVRYVIGTSGGALLGFFVSQLRENGPEGLTDILWKKDAHRYLRSSDVFGWTDLLRYASVVVSFLVLCVLLALLSIPERGPLNPVSRPELSAWRLRLTLAVVPLLLFAPLLVRLSNQRSPSAAEQVPEFEGLIYAVLAMLAMFADQCMILEREPRKNGRPWAPPSLPVLFGVALIAFALRGNGWASAPLTFWPAYAVLAPLVLFCGLILPLRIRASSSGMRGTARLALEILAPTGLALLLGVPLAGDAGDQMSSIKVPFYITGFALVLLLLLANFLLRPSATRLKGAAWWTAYGASLLLASLLVINLCWPAEQGAGGPGSALSAHTLELSVGTFLLCVGLLVTFAGAVSWAYAAQPRYHLATTQDFLIGFVVVLTHMMVVALILWTVTELLPDWLSPLELTGEFWTWLIGASLVFGLILLAIALLGRQQSRLVVQLRRSFLFLCSHHPNGEFVTRRFLRVAVLCVFALGWWNLVVAPALYGNRQARQYLDGAVARFYAKAGTDARYHPTSRFIAPANLLERDGTRYFLFIPEGDECPPVPRRPTSGAMWYPYSVHSDLAAPRGCTQVKEEDFLTRVIFASGSPFPIFPAHRLSLDGQEVSLVDGGYSNNTPVDAARTVSAEQVLIVESSNPLKAGSDRSRMATAVLSVRGKLVENLGRLPGFLFERSQQVDRLSRRDLFVISISPSREEKDWPPLFDFRRQTVQRMEQVAEADLTRRVGMVQSWGRPSFALSVLVEKHENGAHSSHPH